MSNIDNIKISLDQFKTKLDQVKSKNSLKHKSSYYGYDILSNINHLSNIIEHNLNIFTESKNIIDIGCADGDLSFFLEYMYPDKNYTCLDYSKTNWNNLEGLKKLQNKLKSKVKIIDEDIEELQLSEKYDLTIALGLLYHIKNPIRFLEVIQKHSDYVLFSTRIASFTPDSKYNISKYSYGYFPSHNEINNDNTNWWIFTDSCLRKMFERIGFNIVSETILSSDKISLPNDPDKDARYFALLKNKF